MADSMREEEQGHRNLSCSERLHAGGKEEREVFVNTCYLMFRESQPNFVYFAEGHETTR